MARSIYVPQAGGFVDFKDTATDAEIVSYLKSKYAPAPAPVQQEPAEPAPTGPDESTLMGRAAYGFATGFTDIPGGIAGLFVPAEKLGETSAGQFSEEARKYLQDTFGIDPTKDPTAAQQAMQALGSVGSFLVPGAGAAKIASLAGRGAKAAGALTAAEELIAAERAARAAKLAGSATAAAQGAALGSAQRAEKVQSQLESGMEISPEEQLAAQRLDAFVGVSEAVPLGRFFGPLTQVLSKVPVSKAPIVEKIIKSRLASITKAGVAEGAQEAASGIANDLVEYGVYNPDVQFGQDLLSNAGTGAFAGSFVESVIQMAAGRRLRPYRQLQADLAAEGQQNAIEARQGAVSSAAERLRELNVEGPVEVSQEEIDNEPVAVIKTKAGNVVGRLPDIESANQAVDLYQQKTGAKVRVVEPVKPPDIFPVKIAGQSFGSMDDIVNTQAALRDRLASTTEFLADTPSVERNAKLRGVAPDFYRKQVENDAKKIAVDLEKFDEFVRVAAPEPMAPEPAADIEKVNILRGPASRGEPLPLPGEPTEAAAEPVEAVAQPEVSGPIGAAEAAPEAPPEAPIGGIAAIAEPEITAVSLEEPIGSKKMPIPVQVEPEGKPSVGVLPETARKPITPAEAKAIVSEPREYTPEQKAYDEKLYDELKKRLDNIATPDVKLELKEMVDTLPGYLVRGYVRSNGEPNGVATILEISKGIYDPKLTIDQHVNKLLDVLNHEIIHIVRRQLRPVEWRALSRAVETTKVPGKKYTYLDKAQAVYTPNGRPMAPQYADPDAVVEEAVAEMYKDWVRNGLAPPQTRGPFNRITEFFRRIFRALKSSSYESVFKAIESGEVRGREIQPQAQQVETKFSAAPLYDTEDFRQWSAGNQLVNEDGTPIKLYTGTSKDTIFGSFKDSPRGTWVTSDPEIASQYSVENDSMGHKLERVGPRYEYVKTNTASRVIPLYARAKNILDLSEQTGSDEFLKANNLDPNKFPGVNGYQKYQAAVTRMAKLNGYDAIKWGDGVWAILYPENLKSQLNEFTKKSLESKKFSAAPLTDITWTDDRTDLEIKISGYQDGRSKAYVGWVNPRDFIAATDEGKKSVRSQIEKASNYYDDLGRISENRQSPYLRVSDDLKRVTGHEGRHRMAALARMGIESVPVVVTNYNGEMRTPISSLTLRPQGTAKNSVTVKDLIPLAFEYRNQIVERMQQPTSGMRFSAAPLPAYIETKNDTLFAKHDNVPFHKMIFDYLFAPDVGGKTLRSPVYGDINIGKWTQIGLASRAALVDKDAGLANLEKLLNQKITGNFERMTADYSATVAMAMRNRSSHLTAAMIRMGVLEVDYARPGDILSASLKVTENPDNLLNVVKVLMEPGPADSRTGEQKDKREVFKSYAVAMRAKNKKAAGLSVPGEVDDAYINATIPFTEQNYPEVVEAYKMYQRFNKKLLESAVKAGLIKRTELDNLTRQMDYYGFYHEVYDTAMVPGMATKTASQFKLRPYKGSTYGNLVNDPVFVMIQNAQFWVDSIAKNLATTKAFNVAKIMGEARLLGTGEDPKEQDGEQQQVMFYKKDGVQQRFAVKDPLLVTALGSSDSVDLGGFMKILGLPTQLIRESVTRDPGFMVANLLRDTLSSWITSGEDITPFIGTMQGFKKGLKKESSFQALMGRGVVGSYDLAMLSPAELANKISRIATPKNVHIVPNLENGIGAATALWDRLGALSEASDAATRIAVYESALAQGMSEAEASFRAIEIMDFSRRGGSAVLGVLTKLIPFLNARIQGLDVLWQAGKAGYRVATGQTVGERDANLGKKFLIRGGMLAALSMALEMWNTDDEDYEQLDEYIKTGNLLIPLKSLGMDGEFLAIPKPFEAGLLFSTFPQQFYRTMVGEASTRENLNLFTTQFASTFGVNWVPQALLPIAEVTWNIDFYTGLPLISEGKARLAPELQYNSGTSTISMMLGQIPVKYNLLTGKFEGVSPIVIENLITGYTGPIGSMIVQAAGVAMDGFNIGPERMPTDLTKLPVVKRVFIDAEKKNPKVVTQAYELFQIMDEANRSFSRLKQIGDVEAIKDFVEENRDVLSYRKYVFKMVDGLNKLNARERQIERDPEMTADEKREAMLKLRETRINIASKVDEINQKLGR